MASEARSVESLEAELKSVRVGIAALERQPELMRERESARQSPRRGGGVETPREATSRCLPSTREVTAPLAAEGVGCDNVTPVTVAPRLSDSPQDASTELAIVSSGCSEQAREKGGEDAVPDRRRIVIPGEELTGQIADSQEQRPNVEDVTFEAAGRTEPDHRSQCDAVCGQSAAGASGSQSDDDAMSRREQPVVALPRGEQTKRQQRDELLLDASVCPACPASLVLHRTKGTRLPVSAEKGNPGKQDDELPEIEHLFVPAKQHERPVEGRGFSSYEVSYASGAGKGPLAGEELPGEISRRREAKQSFLNGRREFPPTQVESPAKARRSFLFT